MQTNDIRKLEKIYFEKILDILDNPNSEFKKNLEEIERITNKKYKSLALLWGKKNKIDIAVERLLRYHLYTGLKKKGVYASPLSPDVAIELKNIILCLDAKTIDLDGNPGDDKYLLFGKNQITFENIPITKTKRQKNSNWQGLSFPPQLEKSFFDINGKEKPCLTYFVNFCYEDDNTTFKFSHLTVTCIPHAQIIKDEYDNDIIQNYKSWDYIKKDQFASAYDPIKDTNIVKKANWIAVDYDTKGKKVTSYIDPSIKHPLDKNQLCLRKKPENSGTVWKVALWGTSARIYKTKIKNRIDENGQPWEGVKEFRIGYGHKLNPKTKKKLSKFRNGVKTIDRYAEIQSLKKLQGIN